MKTDSLIIKIRLFPVLAAFLLSACARSGSLDYQETVPLSPELTVSHFETREMLEPYRLEVAELKTPIGHAAETMVLLGHDGPLESWITDVVRKAASDHLGRPVDAAFMNGGGIRASLPRGPVSLFEISQILPFENTIVVYEVTGVEMMLLGEKFADAFGYFPISGMRIEADSGKNLTRMTINGEPVDPGETYFVATNNYLADGGDGMKMLLDFPNRMNTDLKLRDIVIEEVVRLGDQGKAITPPEEPFRYRFEGKTREVLQ